VPTITFLQIFNLFDLKEWDAKAFPRTIPG